MSGGERRSAAGFAFRSLPQKAFPSLEDRDIRDRLRKWWEGGSPLRERRLAGAGGGGWAGKGRAALRVEVVTAPSGLPRSAGGGSVRSTHLTGSLLSIFQA